MDYFTENAERVIRTATDIAVDYGRAYVGTEHLLYALTTVPGVAHDVLLKHLRLDELENVISEAVMADNAIYKVRTTENSAKMKEILLSAKEMAAAQNMEKVGTSHILLALLKENDCIAVRILNSMKKDLQKLYVDTLRACGYSQNDVKKEVAKLKKKGQSGTSYERFTKDLTEEARAGRLDPCIGRIDEIKRIVEILCRRTKNNPCLLGEPGVGKTAIIEGLAQLIATGGVPKSMADTRILTLDLAGMVAGTKYRGEFEERIKAVIDDVMAAGNIVLFLDEIHTIIGTGSAEGSLDAANILKPALSRGELRVIGATTREEYRKYFEKDAALARRFQPVDVNEPTIDETVKILMGLRSYFETHHGVIISDEAVESAVKLSSRYVADRFLPDKAIDCLDEACSKAKLKTFKIKPEIFELEDRVSDIENRIDNAISDDDAETVSELKKEKKKLLLRIEKLKGSIKKDESVTVSEDDVCDVISAQSKVPVSRLKESENARLLKLEEVLHKRVIGQEEAVSAVAKAVRRGKAGVKDPNRPIGSFLFLGPTGVGKTELSKALAEALFGKDTSIIRVDMSEYMEKHSVSKMIGSPPGYVGHEEGGQLSEQVRQKPYSIVLFDEIEKAHPDVFNVLLQVLDEGRITDSQGRTVSFKNTVIIMTSNAGAQNIVNPKMLGFNSGSDEKRDYEFMKNSVMDEVKKMFKPEFINRIDDIIVFHPLSTDEIKNIVKLMLNNIKKMISETKNIKLVFRESFIAHIADVGYDVKYGARPIKRAIQDELEDNLADLLISGEAKDGDTVKVSYKNNKTVVEVALG